MKILLTGAEGFIGYHLAQSLVEIHEVHAIVRQGNNLPAGVKVITMDLASTLSEGSLPPNIDVIVHLAQSRRFREFPDGVQDTFKVNVFSTIQLLDYAVRSNCKQFIYASSGSVYRPKNSRLNENENIEPDNPYAISKYSTEMVAKCYSKFFDVVNLRIFFPYGPRQVNMFLPNLITSIREGRPVKISGSDSGLTFSPLYIDDLIDVFVNTIERLLSGTFNIGGSEIVTLFDAANQIGRYLSVEPTFEYSLDGEVISILSDNSLIESVLGRRVGTTKFVDGIIQTIKSLRS